MRLHFLGANRQVTGSRYLLEAAGLRVMIDCGLFQERAFLSRNWEPSPVAPDSIDALILTHAHLDHTGLVPKLVRDGYRGRIVATEPTADLAGIIMEDSGKIHEEDVAYKKRRHRREKRKGPHPDVPLYTVEDAREARKLIEGVGYGEPVPIAKGGDLSVMFHEAGHILGSAVVEFEVREHGESRRIVFSGDLGQWHKPLIGDPTLLEVADHVVMESTYGNRSHRKHGDPAERLGKIIRDTAESGGTVVIPTFAVERAQELIYHIGRLVHEDRIPELPIFLDSPMAVDVTDVFRQHRSYLDEETQKLFASGEPPLRFPGLYMVRRAEDSRSINSVEGPKMVLASSGMCTGGRIKHHLRQYLGDERSVVLFVGYQAVGTLGRQILEGHKQVRIHGRQYRVRARVEHLNGFSAHGDRGDLLRWVGAFRDAPRQIFLTHGEEDAARSLAKDIDEQLGWPVQVPEYLHVAEL